MASTMPLISRCMVAALADHDIALGSRFLGRVEGASARRMAMLRTATKVSNRLSGIELTDSHCGLRAFRASAAPALRITQDRMAHASELLRKIKTSGLRLVEVPVTIKYTEHSKSKGPGRHPGRAHPVRLLLPRVMIIRILLLLGLAASGWFIFLRRNKLPLHIMTVFLLIGVGAAAIIFPNITQIVAHFVGVGRGTDLVLYMSVVVVMFVLLHYYTKFVELQRQLTEVTRELAILRAEVDRVAPHDQAS